LAGDEHKLEFRYLDFICFGSSHDSFIFALLDPANYPNL